MLYYFCTSSNRFFPIKKFGVIKIEQDKGMAKIIVKCECGCERKYEEILPASLL